ncbi:MAG: cadherin-like beta sandwich domain-containing protein [Deltaproteobacteria bacterium]|jgi:hypothetical protein|nr:cadherin-like beta sandwich domain-containing protein [Deltaproteobacteria bacterium]MDL1989082.1 cadherin-like beta sandwich domain-containing protein [Deltaproteobacteria bacterium]
MDSNLFGISNPFEYAKKLEREYERLSSSSSKSIQDEVDHALNFSFVAWHLVDRVFNHPDTHKALKEKGIDSFKEFHTQVFRSCPELQICYDLSINFKHFNDERNKAKTVKYTAKVPESVVTSINGVPISRIAKINGMPISIGKNSTGKLVVTKTDGTKLNFMDIAGAVNAYWQRELQLLKTYRDRDTGAADKAAIQLVKVQPCQSLVSDT